MKILACALKNKIKNKNFLKLLKGLFSRLNLFQFNPSRIGPLIMSREPMLTAQGTFNFWFRNRNNYNLKFQRNYNL